MNVGFVGTGNMGRPMAANILKAGHQMTVYDLSAEATAPLERAGATRATDLPALARAVRVTMLSLPDARAVEAALFGSSAASNASIGISVFTTKLKISASTSPFGNRISLGSIPALATTVLIKSF